jgi:F-type H+-transporting ATPase subunit delta
MSSLAPLKGSVDPAARVYAQALADGAEAQGGLPLLQEVGKHLARAAEDWRSRRSFAMYFLSPRVADARKQQAADGLAGLGAPPVLRNFLRLLLRRNRLLHLPAIADTFHALLDRRLGRLPVTLATATAMSPDAVLRWTEVLRRALGKDPVVRHVVRPELVAGAVVIAGDVVADGSARRQLDDLRRRIIESGQRERATHATES